MSEARGRILARLRAAQRTATLPVVRGDWRYAPPVRTPAEALERFQRELALLAVETHVVATEEDVRARVEAIVSRRRVLAWDPEHLPYGVGALVPGAVRGRGPREAQASAEVGLTGCEAAIAETGSLAVLSGPGRSRTVSLLPPLHVAVVRRADLFFSMADFLGARADRIASAASCTFITGPSRTADIELTLIQGVHGPGAVVVVVGP